MHYCDTVGQLEEACFVVHVSNDILYLYRVGCDTEDVLNAEGDYLFYQLMILPSVSKIE